MSGVRGLGTLYGCNRSTSLTTLSSDVNFRHGPSVPIGIEQPIVPRTARIPVPTQYGVVQLGIKHIQVTRGTLLWPQRRVT